MQRKDTPNHGLDNSATVVSSSSSSTITSSVARFVHLPLVQSGVCTVQNYAIGRLALETAGSAVGIASKYTEPVQARFSAQISKVDELANKSLDYVECHYPIVKKPTKEVIGDVSQPFVDTYEAYKQYQDNLQSTIETRVANPVLDAVKNVQNQIAPIARTIDGKLTPVVDTYDTFVSRWLPAEEAGAPAENTEEDWSQTVRALNVSVRAQRRLSRHLLGQLTRTQTYTAVHLRQIQQSNVLLMRATESVNYLNDRLVDTYTSARQNAIGLGAVVLGEDFGAKPLPQAVQNRIIQLSRALLEQTNLISTYVLNHAGTFPDYVQERLRPMVVYFTEQYQHAVLDASREDLTAVQKAQCIIKHTTEKTLPILKNGLEVLGDTAQSYQTGIASSITVTADSVKERIWSTARGLGVK